MIRFLRLSVIAPALTYGCLLLLLTTASAAQTPAHSAGNDTGEKTYTTQCVFCHAADGKGSEVGKSLKVKDLTSSEVQSETDEVLRHVIEAGKNGMPPFKDKLTADEITQLVKYLRQFAPAKASSVSAK